MLINLAGGGGGSFWSYWGNKGAVTLGAICGNILIFSDVNVTHSHCGVIFSYGWIRTI